MHPDEFLASRKEDWQALSRLVELGQADMRRLAPADIRRLSQLYRSAASDLALAQRDFPAQAVTAYLNQLVGRAHGVIYRGEPVTWQRAMRFYRSDFPALFRRTWIYTLISLLLFLGPALFAGVGTSLFPNSADWMLPQSVQSRIADIRNRNLWTDIPLQERPYASSFIMQNNIRVSILAFAGGMTGGLLTGWMLVVNGLTLGGVLGLTAHYGIGLEMSSFVIGHGVIELSVIILSGSSGLILAWGLISPGLLRRRDALWLAAQTAVRLLLGAAPFLVIAGLIEGFISPSTAILWPVKWAVGIGSGLLFYGYLFLGGRNKADRSYNRAWV